MQRRKLAGGMRSQGRFEYITCRMPHEPTICRNVFGVGKCVVSCHVMSQ